MKTALASMTATLYGSNIHYVAELFTFYFPGGTQRWTSADVPVVSASTTWSLGPTIVSEGGRVAEGMEVADLRLTMDFGTASLGGTTARLVGLYGGFDNVRVLHQRSYSTSSFGDCSAGLVTEFDGNITEVNPGSTQIELTVTSFMARLKTKVPKRQMNWMCPYVLGDAGCGVNLAAFSVTGTAASGSNQSVVVLSGSNPGAGYFMNGRVSISSGSMTGLVRGVTLSADSGSNHALTIFPPLPSAPAAGTAISVSRGCTKFLSVCTGTFNNGPRFGGFTTLPVGNS